MILPRFEFVEPTSVQEVCSALQQHAGKAKVIAGGTDLLVSMKRKAVTAKVIISLAKIPQLKEISYSGDNGLKIGSLLTMAELAESKIVLDRFPALAKAAGKLGSPQVRHRATIGGNVSSARPAADSLGPLIGYGAEAKIVGIQGERLVTLEEFCLGPGKTVLGPSEILTEILIKPPIPDTCSSYIKFGVRKAMEIAMVSVTSVITLSPGDNSCQAARVVLGAVAPRFIRCPGSEEVLIGSRITENLAAKAGTSAAHFCSPISDIRGSAEYRRTLVEVLTKRSILEACHIRAA